MRANELALIDILGATFSVGDVGRADIIEGACSDAYGVVKYMNQEILIDEGLTKEKRGETILHEILHVVDHATGSQLDEDVIHRLTRGLWSVLQGNPHIIKEIVPNLAEYIKEDNS